MLAQHIIRDEYINPVHYTVNHELPPFYDLAATTAQAGTHKWAKMGAVVYRRRQLLAAGCNQLKSHPVQARYRNRNDRIYLHAEINAIIRAKQDLTGTSMTVVRLKKLRQFSSETTLGISLICSGCRAACEAAGIKEVNYYDGVNWICEYVK